MNIKDPEVHAMARELAARRGTTVTDEVRQALTAELERTPDRSSPSARAARKAEILALCRRCKATQQWNDRTSQELMDALYDANGLPA